MEGRELADYFLLPMLTCAVGANPVVGMAIFIFDRVESFGLL